MDLSLVQDRMYHRSIVAGQTIKSRGGDDAPEIYVIVTGIIDMFRHPDDTEPLNTLCSGDSFGEYAFFGGKTTASYRARTDATLPKFFIAIL